MRSLKLFVIILFSALFLASFGGKFFSTKVTGQTGVLSAPTGVSASDADYNNKVGINWNAVRGATNYRIFRNTTNDPATATEVGATAAASFFDTTGNANQTYFYWVRAENSSSTSAFSQSDQGLRTGTAQQGPVPPLQPPNAPAGNTVTAAKAYLGKILFWDEQLSATRTVSCGTCHQAGKGGSDARSFAGTAALSTNPGFDTIPGTADDVVGSRGVPQNLADGTYQWSSAFGFRDQVTNRKSPSYINAAYAPILFWDGRATGTYRDPITNDIILNNGAALESQAAGPPINAGEMSHAGQNWIQVAAQIQNAKPLALSPNVPTALRDWIDNRTYPELFAEAFGTSEVSAARISLAIGTFERTLYSDRTPLDLANAGITPLTAQENRGRNVFNQAQCNVCHAGNLLTDNSFRNIGIRPVIEDQGRFGVTGNQGDRGEFRVPSLRNVELRAPYMHNGRFATLEDVVEFYNRGGDFRNEPNFQGNLIQPRNLSAQQKADLVAFLKRPLTDSRVAQESGPFDRPQLYTESNRVPTIMGSGLAGSNNQVPQPMAIEPPLVGNPSFTVAVTNALDGANAVLVVSENDPGATTNIPSSGSFARVAVTLGGNGAGNGNGSASLTIPNDASLVGRTFFGRWYVTDAGAAGGVAVSPAFRFTVFGEATAAASRAKHADFDGDGRSDLSVFRPSEGVWYIQRSAANNFSATPFGISSDKLAPADFDGDAKADIAVFRSGVWYWLNSSDNQFRAVQFGAASDKPQPGDYDGDGRDDIAVFRPSDGSWYIQQSRDGFKATQFGISTDRPVAADYDGDGKTDLGVYRDGVWYLQRSRDGFTGVQFGIAEDKPVIGDYDGDTKSDLAVYRPSAGAWYILRSGTNSFAATQFGVAADTPSPGDYDGDGKSDLAVFRGSEGNWYILNSSNGSFRGQNWGTNGDVSVPAAIVP